MFPDFGSGPLDTIKTKLMKRLRHVFTFFSKIYSNNTIPFFLQNDKCTGSERQLSDVLIQLQITQSDYSRPCSILFIIDNK